MSEDDIVDDIVKVIKTTPQAQESKFLEQSPRITLFMAGSMLLVTIISLGLVKLIMSTMSLVHAINKSVKGVKNYFYSLLNFN